jgi:DNA repair exonuclease SbcCD ATPase subunit
MTKVHEENQTSEVETPDEAVSLFAQIADEDSNDSDTNADLDDEQLDQDEDEQQHAAKGKGSQQEQQDADPWQSAPEALRAQFNQLQQANSQLQQQYQAVTGRLAPTQRELEALKKKLAEQEQQKANGKTTGPTADEIAGMDDDELAQEWPEVAAALKRREQQLLSRIEERLNPLQERFQQQEIEQVKQRELSRLAQIHPDYQQVVSNPGFRQWLSAQPQAVQSIASSMSADDNIALLNLYKQARGATKPTQRQGKPALKDQAEIPRKGAGRAAMDPNSADPVALFNQIAT